MTLMTLTELEGHKTLLDVHGQLFKRFSFQGNNKSSAKRKAACVLLQGGSVVSVLYLGIKGFNDIPCRCCGQTAKLQQMLTVFSVCA